MCIFFFLFYFFKFSILHLRQINFANTDDKPRSAAVKLETGRLLVEDKDTLRQIKDALLPPLQVPRYRGHKHTVYW